MIAITAKDAKNRFGELMDTAQREPVTIEKHGRPVAVVLSSNEYNQMKLALLRQEVSKGLDQLDKGEYIEIEQNGLQSLFDEIKARGRERRAI